MPLEVATVGDCLEFVRFEHFFVLLGHSSKLPTVVADIYYFMRNNQIVFGINGDLDIVADYARSPRPLVTIERASRSVSGIC